jgi:hypothetical protein
LLKILFAFVFKSINRNLNQWHLYDDDDVFPNVVEGTGLAKYARMLLYEYVSKEDYESFVNSTETVVKKWDCFVAKAHKIAELMYFLQKSENDFLGGFTKFKQNIREAIEVEYFNNKDHPQFFSNETGEINTYGHNAAHALTEACLDGYKGDGVWKGFLEEASEKFFGIVKQACVRAGSFPVEKSDWVDFFSEKVYPDLLKDVFSKEHEEQNKYIQFDVILEILEKAQQTEKEFVIEQGGGVVDMETNKTEITEEGMIGDNEKALDVSGTKIGEEGNEATPTPVVPEKDYFTTVATDIMMSSIMASEKKPPSQLVSANETVVDVVKPLTLPGKTPEPTKEQTNETDSSLTPFPINEVLRDKIFKQLALVVGTDRCQLELYVPNEILTLTDEEEKQWNDKKKAAAEYAVECTIENMSVDNCEQVKKVTEELTHFYTCLTENLVFDMGMRAGYGGNSNKCVCPCW